MVFEYESVKRSREFHDSEAREIRHSWRGLVSRGTTISCQWMGRLWEKLIHLKNLLAFTGLTMCEIDYVMMLSI
jgi:hypothetical protein